MVSLRWLRGWSTRHASRKWELDLFSLESKRVRGINISLGLPGKKENLRRQRQILLRDIQENKKQQSQDAAKGIPIKHKENVFKQRAVKHRSIAQRGCRFSILLRTFKFCLLSPWATWCTNEASPAIRRRLNPLISRGPFYPEFFYKSDFQNMPPKLTRVHFYNII